MIRALDLFAGPGGWDPFGSACWLKPFHDGPCLRRSDGRLDRTHFIPQRRLKVDLRSRGYTPEQIAAALADPRNIGYACRRGHVLLDLKFLRLTAADYPSRLRGFAREYGYAYDAERCEWFAVAVPDTQSRGGISR